MSKNDLKHLPDARKKRWEKHHATPNEWFWDRLDRSGGPDACWPYLGTKNRRDYGRIVWHGRHVHAHRFALMLATGAEDDRSLFACHTCDNPPCCNPAHLWWGTPLDNMRDMLAKQRNPRKRRFDRAELMALRAQGWPYSRLAKYFGVHLSSIGRAIQSENKARSDFESERI